VPVEPPPPEFDDTERLETVTVTEAEVVVFPAASRATAVRMWEPLETPDVFQVPEYGATVSSVPRLEPSSLNWTPATPTLSEAVAEMTVEAETTEVETGVVTVTAGGVVSGGGAEAYW